MKKNTSFLEHVAVSTLWSESLSCWIQYFFLVISNLQCIAISFSSRFLFLKGSQPDTFIQVLRAFSNIIAFRDILRQNENDSLSIVIVISTLFYFSVIVLTFMFTFIHNLTKRKLPNSSILFINILSQFHLAFGFWSTTMIFIEALDDHQSGTVFTLSILAYSTCVRILYFVLLALNFIFGIFMALFSFNPFINAGGLSAHNNTFQLMTFLIKACLAITIFAESLVLEGDTSWFLFGISLVWMVVRHYQLIRNFSYYEYSAMRVATFLSLLCLLNSIVSIIAKSLSQSIDLSVIQVFFMDILMIPFLLKFWHDFFHKIFMQCLSLPNQRLSSERLAFRKLFCLRHLSNRAKIGNNDEQSTDLFELYFFGFFSLPHEKEELFQNIFGSNQHADKKNWKNLSKYINLNSRGAFSKIWKRKMIELIQDFINSRKSNKLRIILTCIFLENIENLMTSIYYLGTVSKSQGLNKIIALKLSEKLESKIQHVLAAKEGKDLNIQDIIKLEFLSTKLIQMIHSNSQKYMKFWKTYNSTKPSLRDLYKKSQEIEMEYNIIQNFWNKTIEKSPKFACSLSVLFSIYLSIVRNSPTSAEQIFQKYDRFALIANKLKDGANILVKDQIIDITNNLMLHVSITKEKLGKILSMSSNVFEILGWQKQSLLGQNINSIIPNFFQEQHNHLMLSHLDNLIKGKNLSNLHSTTISSFLKNKANYIMPCQVYLSLHPFIQSELAYVGLLKIEKTIEENLILSKSGFIEGFSHGLASQLNLRSEGRIHIKEICNNYDEITGYLSKYCPADISEEKFVQENRILIEDFPSELVLQLLNPANNGKERRIVIIEYSTKLKRVKMGDLFKIVLNLRKINSSKNMTNFRLLQLKEEDTVEENDFEIPQEPQEKLLSENVALLTPVSNFCTQSSRQINLRRKFDPASSEREMMHQKKSLLKSNNFDEEICQSSRSSLGKSSTENRTKKIIVPIGKKSGNLHDFDTSSSSMTKKHNTKFEEALKILPKEVGWVILKILLIVYLFVPIITSTVFQVQNNQTLDKIEGNINVLSDSTFRLTKLTELSRAVRIMVLLDVNLMYSKRYDAFFGLNLNVKYQSALSVKQYCDELNTLNNNIRASIYKIESNLQEILNDKIPLYEPDSKETTSSIRFANPFDLATELIAAGNKIASMPLDQINPENHEVKFILNNTMNDILISGEKISPILLEDTRIKLENQKFLIIIFMILQSCFMAIILIIFYGSIANFLAKRNQFIDILLLSGKDNTENQTHIVEKFISFLENYDTNSKRINLKSGLEEFRNLGVNPLLQTTKVKRITADRKGINLSLTKNTISVILFVCLVFSINIAFIFITGSQKKIISSKINIMSKSSFILYKLKLLRTTLYDYIQEDGAAMTRNNFGDVEWNNLFSEVSNFQDFFVKDLLDKYYGIGDDEEMSQIVKGNICDALKVAPEAKPFCLMLGSGVLEKGLIGLNTYVLASLSSVKSSYDNSQKSFNDKFLAINSAEMIIIDFLEFSFSYQAFELIDRLMKSRIKDDLRGFKIHLQTIIIIYTVISLLFGILAWYKITSNFEKEFGCWRKMIKLIPYQILIHNKLLKSFLIKTSHGVLNNLH